MIKMTNWVGQRVMFSNKFNRKTKLDLNKGDYYKVIEFTDYEFKVKDDFNQVGWVDRTLFKTDKE